MKKGLFIRHHNNPLITTKDLPYQANAVFNAGAADLGDEVLLLLRVEDCRITWVEELNASPCGRGALVGCSPGGRRSPSHRDG